MSTTRTTGRRRRTLAGLATVSLLVAGLTACTGGEEPRGFMSGALKG